MLCCLHISGLNFKTGKNIQPIKLLINRLRVIKTTVVKSAE